MKVDKVTFGAALKILRRIKSTEDLVEIRELADELEWALFYAIVDDAGKL